jgi:hypothetical protein
MKVHINPDHHAIIAALPAEAGVDDPGHHHQNTITAQAMEEPKDPSLLGNIRL